MSSKRARASPAPGEQGKRPKIATVILKFPVSFSQEDKDEVRAVVAFGNQQCMALPPCLSMPTLMMPMLCSGLCMITCITAPAVLLDRVGCNTSSTQHIMLLLLSWVMSCASAL